MSKVLEELASECEVLCDLEILGLIKPRISVRIDESTSGVLF
jgi:hypothetical protein